MDVVYKCKCLKEEVTVTVPDRFEDSPVEEWVGNIVANCISRTHLGLA